MVECLIETMVRPCINRKCCVYFQLHQIGNTWQYTIKWHLGKNLPATNDKSNKQSIVSVTSKPRQQSDKGLITVESWTSHEEGRNATGNHLALYVKVQRGQSPVAGAKVIARLEVPHINGTTLEFAPLELLDDGFAGNNFDQLLQALFLEQYLFKTVQTSTPIISST